MDVLFEKPGRHGAQAIGRSPWLQSVYVEDADHLIGRIVPVEIEHGQQNSLKGRLVQDGAVTLKQRAKEDQPFGA